MKQIAPWKRFLRFVPKSKQKRDENGKRLCLVCDDSLPKGRSSYCNDEHANINNPSMMRALVRRRDRGICAACGLDTGTVAAPSYIHWYATNHHWEADHVVPVAEGGGLCGLDGYRTLCKGYGTNNCHGKESGALRKRLNERKAIEKAQKETGRLFA